MVETRDTRRPVGHDAATTDELGDHELATGWRHRRGGSVRVRITLAASLVTAVAVALTGWLLTRSVHDTQTGQIRDRIEANVDQVASRLSHDATLDAAVADIPLVAVRNDAGDLLITNPRPGVTGDGQESTLYVGSGVPGVGANNSQTGQVIREAPDDSSDHGVVVFRECTARALGDASEAGAGGQDVPVTDGEAGPPPAGVDPCADMGQAGGAAGSGQGDAPIDGGEFFISASASRPESVTRQVATRNYGTVTVTALAPVDEVARSVDAVTKALWLLLPALVGVVALLAWWLVGRALRPVEAIRREAESIEGPTIQRRLPEPRSDDEIGRLARTMNAMLGRLDQSARRQRQFVSDASHELRSPVTAIRTDLEVALHEGDRADWPAVARAVLAEEGRLETLLGDLLVLASDDEAASAQHPATVDMAWLAEEEVGRGRRVPVALVLDPAEPEDDEMIVEGVGTRLERALANLVDNAARHARDEVKVTVHRKGERVRVLVDDDGIGIPVADRERIFERFARLDGSRARDRGGAGLGLAVVRSIATRHDGCVWADASPLGGARFILDLPAARPQHG